MSKKHKQFSRTEPAKAKPSVAPAGTPVAPSAPEVPAANQQQVTPATGESSATDSGLSAAKGQSETSGRPTTPDVVSAVQPEWPEQTTGSRAAAEVRAEIDKATKQAVKITSEPQPRRGGAGWFIPPQQPSGFGVKKD